MRVVIDTVVFISSFISTGTLSRIIDLWKEGRITFCLSGPIIEEYLEVLEQLWIENEEEVHEVLHLFASGFNSIFTIKTPDLQILDDNKVDNKLFQCAVSLEAQYIISGDRAVLAVADYLGIRVVAPKQFVDLMKAD